MKRHTVTFYPGRRSIEVETGITIWEAANRLGMKITGPCGGQGKCGRCKVICSGLTGDEGREGLSKEEWGAGIRFACRTRIWGDLDVIVPFLDSSKMRVVSTHAPLNIVELEPLSSPIHKGELGLAIDIGTTTVALSVMDLKTGKEIATASDYNRQILLGEDVLSRIEYAEDEGPERLKSLVLETINDLISYCSEEPFFEQNIKAVYVSGNTTMIHLFLGIDPSPIRYEPFEPVVREYSMLGRDSGLKVNSKAMVVVMPSISAYVGGDVTSDILHSGLDLNSGLSLLVDVGTNGEVALGNNDFLISASSSAGPSFEGGEIFCGMRASPGAIEGLSINETGKYSARVIGGGVAKGICGSGLIDLLAELVRHGHVDKKGRFTDKAKAEIYQDGKRVLIDGAKGIFITEDEIQSLIRTKAAIFSAYHSLLLNLGLNFGDVEHMYICGGFGNHLDLENSIRIGLLPDIPRERFSYLGNSSLAGAKMALLSRTARERLKQIFQRLTYLDLSNNAVFFQEYSSALFLPHTDLSLFPSLK